MNKKYKRLSKRMDELEEALVIKIKEIEGNMITIMDILEGRLTKSIVPTKNNEFKEIKNDK